MVMSNKVNIQTESIEVPVAIAAGTPSVIAREVKLFINLLQTGEIDSGHSLVPAAALDVSDQATITPASEVLEL